MRIPKSKLKSHQFSRGCRYCRFDNTATGIAYQGAPLGTSDKIDMVLLQDAFDKSVCINVCTADMSAFDESKPIRYCPMCGRRLNA